MIKILSDSFQIGVYIKPNNNSSDPNAEFAVRARNLTGSRMFQNWQNKQQSFVKDKWVLVHKPSDLVVYLGQWEMIQSTSAFQEKMYQSKIVLTKLVYFYFRNIYFPQILYFVTFNIVFRDIISTKCKETLQSVSDIKNMNSLNFKGYVLVLTKCMYVPLVKLGWQKQGSLLPLCLHLNFIAMSWC